MINAALECSAGLDAGCEVVAASLSLVAQDLRELFDVYGGKALFVLQEHEVGDLFEDWDQQDASNVLKRLKEGFETRCVWLCVILFKLVSLMRSYDTGTARWKCS